MSSPTPASLTTLDGLLAGVLLVQNPEILGMLFAKDEDEFLGVAERALSRCIGEIESGGKEYRRLHELGLSKMLASMLRLSGFKVEPEAYTNGHVDVTIRHYDPARFTYLGECKIYKGYNHHRDGCVQVLGYCSGREQRAFSLDFFKVQKMYPKLAALRARFAKERGALKQRRASRGHFIKGAFLTTHRHHSSGTDVEVLHLGCNLHVAGAPKKAKRVAGTRKAVATTAHVKPRRTGTKANKPRAGTR